ncbi:hypothetical protein K3556_09735 [Aliiroseovarius sp. M344]|nr:hypothetical protein [Aliiroseovarius sp. M344]UWQ13243.1 hypothetical protein K3556_09735 [Aliiroseovarius sp. M344]
MNMTTYTQRERERIVAIHTDIANAIERQDSGAVSTHLSNLEAETQKLA